MTRYFVAFNIVKAQSGIVTVVPCSAIMELEEDYFQEPANLVALQKKLENDAVPIDSLKSGTIMISNFVDVGMPKPAKMVPNEPTVREAEG